MTKIFNFLSVSALWIAFVAIFRPALLCTVGGFPMVWNAGIATFFATWGVYAWDRASDSKEDLLNNPDRAILARYPIKSLAIISYVAAICFVALWDIWRLPSILIFGLAGATYTMRIRGVRPKDLPGGKNLIVAGASAICYAGLVGGTWQSYALAFLVIFIDTVIFDLRDIKGDALEGIRTIPVMLGWSRTLLIMSVVNVALFMLSPTVAVLGLAWLIYFAKERPILQYDFLVDGWMLWAWLLLKLSLVTIF
jgi:4-hydroxybenzoate polyprenyltransferase